MMRNSRKFLPYLLLVLVLFTSCKAYKKIPYMEGAATLSDTDLVENNAQNPIRILPKDMLSIVVAAPGNEEAVLGFNMTTPSTLSLQTGSSSLYSTPTLQNYIVDEKGMIEFPALGKLHVGGMTRVELEQLIKDKLMKGYLTTEPIVTIRFLNFKVSVLGEVVRPGSFNVTNERITILEALALAGDLTIYGRRDNVLLTREDENGIKKYVTINLQDKYLITSPYYYLTQNDVLYVQPNKTKGNTSSVGSVESMTLSATSILISMVNLLINVLR